MTPRRFLLDTNVSIGYLDGHEPARKLLELRGATPLNSAMSQISRIEMLGFAALPLDAENHIVELLQAVAILPIDEAVEREAIAIRRRTRLKLPDAIIAATARAHGLELLTLDGRFKSTIESL